MRKHPVFISAVVLIALAVLISALILVIAVVLILILVLILIVVLVLILILVIHVRSSNLVLCGCSAMLFCPLFQDLSLALKRMLAIRPEKTAVVIPDALAFRPPEKIPRNPSS